MLGLRLEAHMVAGDGYEISEETNFRSEEARLRNVKFLFYPLLKGTFISILHLHRPLESTLCTDPLLEGNGNPLQYSCLENPMDGGAW